MRISVWFEYLCYRSTIIIVFLIVSARGSTLHVKARILVQATIYRRLLIGRDGHLDQPEAYDIS